MQRTGALSFTAPLFVAALASRMPAQTATAQLVAPRTSAPSTFQVIRHYLWSGDFV
jgi:hypothetical protein